MMNYTPHANPAAEARRKRPVSPRLPLSLALCVGLLGLTMSGSANASSIRCGTRVISEGDHVSKLVRYCGEPDFAHTRRAHVPFFDSVSGTTFYPPGVAELWIEEWTYNLGPHKLMRLVTLESGVVRDIKHLGYGYSERRQ